MSSKFCFPDASTLTLELTRMTCGGLRLDYKIAGATDDIERDDDGNPSPVHLGQAQELAQELLAAFLRQRGVQ